MKVCVVQPRYSFDEKEIDSCFENLIALLNECDESMDIIVLPEYSDALADVKGKDGFYRRVKNTRRFYLKKRKN